MSWKMGSCRATRACCLNAIQGLPVVHRHLLQGASELGRCRVAGGRCALPSRRGRQGADRRLCTPQQLIVTTQLVQPLAPVAKYTAVTSPWENRAKKQGALRGRGADGDTSLADHRSRRRRRGSQRLALTSFTLLPRAGQASADPLQLQAPQGRVNLEEGGELPPSWLDTRSMKEGYRSTASPPTPIATRPPRLHVTLPCQRLQRPHHQSQQPAAPPVTRATQQPHSS
jgi:hypothetical protein